MKRASINGLTYDDIQMLLSSLGIAFEDGSIYGGCDDNEPEWRAVNARGDKLRDKLYVALRKVMQEGVR